MYEGPQGIGNKSIRKVKKGVIFFGRGYGLPKFLPKNESLPKSLPKKKSLPKSLPKKKK